MVKPFQFSRLPKIVFKNGAIADLPSLIAKFGTNLLLVTGKSSFQSSKFAVQLFDDLKKKGITLHTLSIPGEPSPELIDNTVKLYQNESIDIIAGIGGGSTLDAGKAVSAMLGMKESIVDFLEGVGNKEHPGSKIPFIAIPTTSGTGSEATKNAVISRIGNNGFKRSLRLDNFVPDIALVDPELSINCPKNITASSGMDCFTQLTESYLSDKSSEYTDALAMEGLKAIKASLTESYKNGADIDARTGMSFAALTSGICLANAGLGVVHGFASSVGGLYDIPHGTICGTLMAKSNEINLSELRKADNNQVALKKYSRLGELFLDEKGKPDSYYSEGFIQFLYKLSDELGLTGLGSYNIKETDIVSICSLTDVKNNPVKLTQENLQEILKSVIR
jgi:alcohol dehydrogenase class IV